MTPVMSEQDTTMKMRKSRQSGCALWLYRIHSQHGRFLVAIIWRLGDGLAITGYASSGGNLSVLFDSRCPINGWKQILFWLFDQGFRPSFRQRSSQTISHFKFWLCTSIYKWSLEPKTKINLEFSLGLVIMTTFWD